MRTINREVSFLDKDKHRATINAEIRELKSGDYEFSASGEFMNSAGQCLDGINPANEWQKQLINLWRECHLNGMSAGTPEQEEAIKKWLDNGNKYDYSQAVEYLKSINLYEVKHPKTAESYFYGNSWIIKDLPSGFDDNLDYILNNVEQAEAEREKQAEQENENKTADELLLEQMHEYDIDENNLDACRAYLEAISADDLSDFNESYQGEYNSNEEFAQNMAEELGAINDVIQWPYTCIDWEHASRELMMDYTEQDGFYFRDI